MSNQYTGFTEYYDMWVTSGYYDYQNIAKEIHSCIGNGCQTLRHLQKAIVNFYPENFLAQA
ncbi:hypothetical protein [Trichodesmium erythraeum]|uniref:hypothetical protein n=1 Tax=Trichodesmium erythraeum TaxID=1206 RepID=UPI00003C9C17|nr:hypothetical protein [Trichodesmium erythraeum GBRTRLIN201]